MQQKRGFFRAKNISIVIAVALAVAMGALMLADIPAPQKAVEKELDAKVFLEHKQ